MSDAVFEDVERMRADPVYLQLKRDLQSEKIVLDFQGWEKFTEYFMRIQRNMQALLANSHDERARQTVDLLNEEAAVFRAGEARLAASKPNLVEINDRITRITEDVRYIDGVLQWKQFTAAIEYARGDLDDAHEVEIVRWAIRSLATMVARLDAHATGVLTSTAAHTVHEIARVLYGKYRALSDALERRERGDAPPGLVVLDIPASEAHAHALGAWVAGDPGNLVRERTRCPVSVADMLRLMAAYAPAFFNLLRTLWDEELRADDWIAQTAQRDLRPPRVAAVLVYLAAPPLFAQIALGPQTRAGIAAKLRAALAADRAHKDEDAIREMLYRASYGAVRRAHAPARWTALAAESHYVAAMVAQWDPARYAESTHPMIVEADRETPWPELLARLLEN